MVKEKRRKGSRGGEVSSAAENNGRKYKGWVGARKLVLTALFITLSGWSEEAAEERIKPSPLACNRGTLLDCAYELLHSYCKEVRTCQVDVEKLSFHT